VSRAPVGVFIAVVNGLMVVVVVVVIVEPIVVVVAEMWWLKMNVDVETVDVINKVT
jgi:hypothetical protein